MDNLYNIKVGDTLDSVIAKLKTPTSIRKFERQNTYIWKHPNLIINVVIVDKQVSAIIWEEK